MKQKIQLLEAFEKLGGIASLGDLYKETDFSQWGTKTPYASIRRLVQDNDEFVKLRPGLYCLEKNLKKYAHFKTGVIITKEHNDLHSFYQARLLELGRMRKFRTYAPPQDRQKKVFSSRLVGDFCDEEALPEFSYKELLNQARTVDAIWFNARKMPAQLFEVEFTTDFIRSLMKFTELQDFYADFFIVSDVSRRRSFDDKMKSATFQSMKKRIKFKSFDLIDKEYNGYMNISSPDELK